MSNLFLYGGHDVAGQPLEIAAVDDRITDIGPSVPAPAGAELIDAKGLLVLPGGVDSHVHFNGPGAADDRRPVWDQVIAVFSTLNRLARDRAERPAIQRYARAKLRPVILSRVGMAAPACASIGHPPSLRSFCAT